MVEVWKDIPGYEGSYRASDKGRICSTDRRDTLGRHVRGRVMKAQVDEKGYLRIRLHGDQKRMFRVHQLVALTFIPNPDSKPEINHRNGRKQDNSVENLEWVTTAENFTHARETGLLKPRRGKDHPCFGKKWVNHPCFGRSGSENPMFGRTGSLSPRSRRVTQQSKTGESIREFESITIASGETGINASCITTVCRGRQKSAGGYRWSYV